MQANYLVNLTHATSHKDSAQNAFYWLVVQFLYLIDTVSRTKELRELRNMILGMNDELKIQFNKIYISNFICCNFFE